MDGALITAISALVEHACASEENRIGYKIWKYHIKPMIPIAQELAVVHEADEEIVTLAVLLHDLAGIEDVSKRKLHHSFGADRACGPLHHAQVPKAKCSTECMVSLQKDL